MKVDVSQVAMLRRDVALWRRIALSLRDELERVEAELEETKAARPLSLLSEREKEVLVLVSQGLSSTQVGERLCIDARTVRSHEVSIRRKLGVNSRTQAALFAIRMGLVDVNEAWAEVEQVQDLKW